MQCNRRFLTIAAVMTLAVSAWAANIKPGTEMSVEVKSTDMRGTASFFGTITGPLKYGDRITVLDSSGAWVKVHHASSGREGWVNSNVLTKKKIALTAGAATETGASSGELAIAGKAFNKEVEGNFKAQHKDIDFTWVDRMADIKNDPATLEKFLKEGGLKAGQGGAQ